MRRPEWIKVRRLDEATRERMNRPLGGLHTVCAEANCPNIGECWQRGTATFMVMGDKCTRSCRFCNVDFGRPEPLNEHEPTLLAASIAELGLDYAVVTCVDRDDLADSGAGHWVACIEAVRERCPAVKLEILTGDFKGSAEHIEQVALARPEVFAHNVETVPRLQSSVRNKGRWDTSLRVLDIARETARRGGFTMLIKSGLMLGLGETLDEVKDAMGLLREHDVELLTIGQYLKPLDRPDKLEVERFPTPEEYSELAEYGLSIGFAGVASSPLTRSSHLAETLYADALAARQRRG